MDYAGWFCRLAGANADTARQCPGLAREHVVWFGNSVDACAALAATRLSSSYKQKLVFRGPAKLPVRFAVSLASARQEHLTAG